MAKIPFVNTRTTKRGQNDLFDMVEVGIPQSLVVLVLTKIYEIQNKR